MIQGTVSDSNTPPGYSQYLSPGDKKRIFPSILSCYIILKRVSLVQSNHNSATLSLWVKSYEKGLWFQSFQSHNVFLSPVKRISDASPPSEVTPGNIITLQTKLQCAADTRTTSLDSGPDNKSLQWGKPSIQYSTKKICKRGGHVLVFVPIFLAPQVL